MIPSAAPSRQNDRRAGSESFESEILGERRFGFQELAYAVPYERLFPCRLGVHLALSSGVAATIRLLRSIHEVVSETTTPLAGSAISSQWSRKASGVSPSRLGCT